MSVLRWMQDNDLAFAILLSGGGVLMGCIVYGIIDAATYFIRRWKDGA